MDLLILAAKARKSGKRNEARKTIISALKENPHDDRGHIALSLVSNSLEEKATCLRRALKIKPDHRQAKHIFTNVLWKQGDMALEQGQIDQARKYFEEAAHWTPEMDRLWFALADCTKDLQQQSELLKKGLSLNPEHVPAKLKLAQIKLQMEARESNSCPLCFDPTENLEFCEGCGAYLSLKDLDAVLGNDPTNDQLIRKAIDRLRKKTSAKPTFEDYCHLGIALLNVQQNLDGLHVLLKALSLEPQHRALESVIEKLRQVVEEPMPGSKPVPPVRQPNRGNILVVDDSITVREFVRKTVLRRGFNVIEAENGLQALAKINESLPDLIFLDINMPNLDGFQVCKIIRDNDSTRQVPVVMLTGKDGFFDKVRGRMVGANEYITKPFKVLTLVNAIQRHFPKSSRTDR